ncbi:MAG TPA: hypothetical protein VJ901_10515 [Thermoanaerobaculia bacterium]|nr:hypothetical protein [Thermoanaerobaculia bacterium]
MPDVLIRDVEEKLLNQLKEAAEAEGRSLDAVLHETLEHAVILRRAQLRSISEKWQKLMAGRPLQSDSTELIRDDRDRR